MTSRPSAQRLLSLAAVVALVVACDAKPIITPTAPPTSVAPTSSPGATPLSSVAPSVSTTPSAATTAWAKVCEIEGGSLGNLIVGPEGFIAAGCAPNVEGDCGKRVVVRSIDGQVWEELEIDAPADIFFASLRRVGDRLFALGYGHYGPDGGAMVWTSLDGRAWSRVESDSFRARTVEDIIESPFGAVAIGYKAPIDSDNTSGFLLWPVDDDGSFGKPRVVATPDSRPFALGAIWTGAEFIAWGYRDGPRIDGPTTVLASSDGRTWTGRGEIAAVNGGVATQILAMGDRLVAVGYEGRAFPLSPRAWTSDDAGRSWTSADVPADDAAMWAIALDGSGLIAHGNTSPESDLQPVSWRSADGTAWTRLPDDEAMPALPGLRAFTTATLGERTCVAGTTVSEAATSRGAIYCRPTQVE